MSTSKKRPAKKAAKKPAFKQGAHGGQRRLNGNSFQPNLKLHAGYEGASTDWKSKPAVGAALAITSVSPDIHTVADYVGNVALSPKYANTKRAHIPVPKDHYAVVFKPRQPFTEEMITQLVDVGVLPRRCRPIKNDPSVGASRIRDILEEFSNDDRNVILAKIIKAENARRQVIAEGLQVDRSSFDKRLTDIRRSNEDFHKILSGDFTKAEG